MKRLTQKDKNGWYLTGDGVYSDQGSPEKFRGEDIDHLASIEDILGDEYELNDLEKALWCKKVVADAFSDNPEATERLRELWFADKEGRCVVLPCKPGDTVWRIVNDATPHITKDQCLTIMLDNGSMWIDLIGGGMNGLYFGQQLFRTYAEAGAALKARERDA